MTKTQPVPPTVNLFLTSVCNYRCRFCFATFPGLKPTLPEAEARQILDELAASGVERVTFVGGEPTLLPYLPGLLAHAKARGLGTCLVSNASRIDDAYLRTIAPDLEILAVSIDSPRDATETLLGRGDGAHVRHAAEVLRQARALGIFTKLNSVITRLNVQDDFSALLEYTKPNRWKPLQMLVIRGENESAADLATADEDFEGFLRRHARFTPIGETNDLMTDSYVMIDPEGRVFQNTGGTHVYGPRVLDGGFPAALAAVGWDAGKFLRRGGLYDWRRASPRGAEPWNSPALDGATSDGSGRGG